MADQDRKSALLTQSHRKLLRGESDQTDRAKRAAYSRIRERIAASLFDFELLLDWAHEDPDRFDRITDEIARESLSEVLRSQIGVVYKLSEIENLDTFGLISDGINIGRAGRIETLKKRFERRDPSLTVWELETLVKEDEITPEERIAFFDEMNTDIRGFDGESFAEFRRALRDPDKIKDQLSLKDVPDIGDIAEDDQQDGTDSTN